MSYLPLAFHYEGMYKIKAGKGYDQNGHPRGPIGGKCSECDGDIISIKMNTSARGFETTSEKVCNKCGLVVPGAFQVLEPKPDYKTPYVATHEEWIERYCHEDDDIAWDAEAYEHATGHRLNTADDVPYGGKDTEAYANINHRNARLGLAINRLAATPASIKQPMQQWRDKQYHDIADDYIHMLELLPYQGADVHYIIDHRGNMFNTRYSMDNIIYHVCLIIGNKDLRKYQEHNRNLYDLLTDRLGR